MVTKAERKNENGTKTVLSSKTFELSGFPKVFKSKKTGLLQIIYRDHMEMYKFHKQWYDCDGEKYDPFKEIEMCEGAGMKRVHASKIHQRTITQEKI